MHVCVLLTVLDPFKGGNHLSLFAALPEVKFTIICNRSKAETCDLPKNVTVITVPGRTGSYYYGFADARFASLVMRKYPPTDSFWRQFHILHFNQVMGPKLRTLKAAGVPMLMTVHHPITADCEVATQESSPAAAFIWQLKYLRLVSWQKAMCNTCDQVMTVSQTVSQRLQKDYGISSNHIAIVPNGVDGSVFVPDTSSSLFDVIALGSFIHPRKGFRYLLEVYQALDAQGLRIADVGRRSDEQMHALKKIRGVTVYGTVSQNDMVRLLRQSSVLVSTSLYEGFGLSLIEALSCGKPAFAFGGGAVFEVLGPIDPSLCVPSRDASALAECVRAFLSLSLADREERGARYRRAVEELYPLRASASALAHLYHEMCR